MNRPRQKGNSFPQYRDVIDSFNEAIDQASYLLKEYPGLIFQEVYNRLQWRKERIKSLKHKLEIEQNHQKKPWLHLLIKQKGDSHLVRTCSGHTDCVSACAFSPDGKRILSGSWDQMLKEWDAQTGEEITTFLGHDNWIRICSYSDDGKKILSASAGELKIWSSGRGAELSTEIGSGGFFLPDENFLIMRMPLSTEPSLRVNEGIKILDGRTNKTLTVLDGQERPLNYAHAFSKDGKRLLTSAGYPRNPGELRVWDIESGREISVFKAHTNEIRSCAFSPDGKLVVSAESAFLQPGILKIWDAETGQELTSLIGHSAEIHTCTFSPDGKQVASGSNDRTVRIWNVKTGKEITCFLDHTAGVHCCAFSPDGRYLLSGSEDRTLKLWRTEIKEENSAHPVHSKLINTISFSAHAKLAASGSQDRSFALWDLENGLLKATMIGMEGSVRTCSFSPADQKALSAGGYPDRPGEIRIWEVKTGKEISQLVSRSDPILLELMAAHWDVVHLLSFSPDGSRMVSGSYDKTLRIWDVHSHEEIAVLSGHLDYVSDCSFSQDGRFIVSSSADKTIILWDAETGQKIMTFSGHLHNVFACRFAADGRHIISGSDDDTFRFWSIKSGKEVRPPIFHPMEWKTCAFSPDGRRIVAPSNDNTIHILDVRQIKDSTVLSGHRDKVYSCLVTPDSRHIVSGSADGIVKVWDVKTKGDISMLVTGARIYILAQDDSGRVVGAGDDAGRVHIMRLTSFEFESPIVNLVHLYRFDLHKWDKEPSARCAWCGQYFIPGKAVRTIIEDLNKTVVKKINEPAFLAMPDEVWEKPELSAKCEHCHNNLRFVPFIIDNRNIHELKQLKIMEDNQ